jgi:dolichol kinase
MKQNQIPNKYRIFNKITTRIRVPNELGRKAVHLAVCLITFLFASLVRQPLLIGGAIATFCLGAYYIEKRGYFAFFKRVNRLSYGHYYMAAGLFGVIILSNILPDRNALIYSFLVVGLADPMAVFGRPLHNFLCRFNPIKPIMEKLTYGGKTLMGLSVFTAVSFFILYIVNSKDLVGGVNSGVLFKYFIISFLLGCVEFLSLFGLDNFTLPIFSYLLYLYL